MGASILVAAISTAFGVVLISATAYIAAVLRANPYIGDSGTLAFVLSFMTFLLVGCRGLRRVDRHREHLRDGRRGAHPPHRAAAAHRRVGAVAAVRDRPSGSRRRRDRRRSSGLSAGRRSPRAGAWLAGRMLGLGDVPFDLVQADLLLPAVIVALTTWAAAWAGSRRVLTVTPLQALGGSVEASRDAVARRSGRQRRGARAVHRRGRAARARCRRRTVQPAGRRHRVRRRHPVVHGPRARRDARDASGAAARRPALRSLGDRAARRRERAALPGAIESHGDRRGDGRHARHDVRGRDRVDQGRADRGGGR